MIVNVDLHLRPAGRDEHRALGVVAIKHNGPLLAPCEEICCDLAGRSLRAHVTAIRQRPDRLPHVYADERPVEEPAAR